MCHVGPVLAFMGYTDTHKNDFCPQAVKVV